MEKRDQHIDDLLFGYFSGELTDPEREELLHWLKADAANEQLLSEMADWWAMAHVPLFMAEMKPDFKKHFGSLATLSTVKPASLRLSLPVKVAASALILLSVGSFGYFAGRGSHVADDATVAYFETEAPRGSVSKVILPDRTVVWVNAGSSLKYAEDFNLQSREVLLDGEAYFDVTPDSLKPFVVKSERLDIKVLGTCFNVKAYSMENNVDVALVSGKVTVSLNTSGSESGDVTLAPERMLSYNKETNRVVVSTVKGNDIYAWTTGMLKFAEKPFPEIARDLERKFNVLIHIESKALSREVFSGSFDDGRSLEQILREIDVDHKYAYSRKGNEVIIRDK